MTHLTLVETHDLKLELKYDTARQFYIRLKASDLEDRNVPPIFINAFKRKKMVECQTLDLVKLNQKVSDSHIEILSMSNRVVQQLIDDIRGDIAPLIKVSEGIAMLDMLASFAHLVTLQQYRKPELTSTLAIRNGRHPMREKIHADRFIPNDVYATGQSRFQIITGCNMSGKSTYIRCVALMTVMAQIGSFLPADYASIPIRHQLFARVSMDDSIEANISTFAAEMRETAFILRNVNSRSMVIVDELGRGTSTRDGLAIAIAIAEALVDSKALVWFVTHFRDLARILSERPGVVNYHLAVDMGSADRMLMLYKLERGIVKEKHYGIALAKVIALPSQVIETAEHVSQTITRNSERQRKTSRVILAARRRKLVLSVREQLVQAKESTMDGQILYHWLRELQAEFVRRMDALDQEETMDREAEQAVTVASGESVDDGVESSLRHDTTGSSDCSSPPRAGRAMMSGALLPMSESGESE